MYFHSLPSRQRGSRYAADLWRFTKQGRRNYYGISDRAAHPRARSTHTSVTGASLFSLFSLFTKDGKTYIGVTLIRNHRRELLVRCKNEREKEESYTV